MEELAPLNLDKHCIAFSLIITDKDYISRHISQNANKVKENFEYFKSCILKKECCFPNYLDRNFVRPPWEGG